MIGATLTAFSIAFCIAGPAVHPVNVMCNYCSHPFIVYSLPIYSWDDCCAARNHTIQFHTFD